jgi:hypothetical protein
MSDQESYVCVRAKAGSSIAAAMMKSAADVDGPASFKRQFSC